MAIWEPSVLLSHSLFCKPSLFSIFSSEGRASDAGVQSSGIFCWHVGGPGVDGENGAEDDEEVRKLGKRSGSCRLGWTPEFLMRCTASTFWFATSPVALLATLGGGCTKDCTTESRSFWFDALPLLSLLALGERGRGEKGKLAMSFDSSGETSLIINMKNCRFGNTEVMSAKYLNTSSLTPGSLKTASQLET